ncbi:BhlA/UviB family holin-like peptide [Clostridium beijerinckii]|uniref:UviB-like protein n=1 Tax=Clostridium beijerinckii TaxID=1520 RepID=A0AAW3W7U9_CLOBE|nr:BhlA/UviB family holin-like peptide [Clostridium beijerinckii]MBC2457764.1 UviB-like protein [Clostridium beijerinckii]MBC2475044.1 UviB-like protein [Clostridium beijerinckii]NOV63512.1 beta-lactamase regulating signal transducer with metallopeptidase domain [Clostridium beijerinckii]NOV73309.1 beta-lactamase regulating signal transducer with metallopeptidase domain [Clostridium beijerinckii]NOW35447.1 beta-lactamase regulating signal transducer with metallopeptidase domain [Clostridium be
MDELIKNAATQGIWAVLSCVLIVYILKAQETRDSKQEEREGNYQEIIRELTDKLNLLDSINLTINEIKNKIN